MEKPPSLFKVRMYGAQDELVGDSFLTPAVPRAGEVIARAGDTWEVTAIMYVFAEHGSRSWQDGDPVLVDMRVRKHRGIHD